MWVMSVLNYIADFFASILDILRNPLPAIFPVLVIFFLIWFFIYYIKAIQPKRGTTEWVQAHLNKGSFTLLAHRHPLQRSDVEPLVVITVVFLFLAIFNLGETNKVDVMGEIDILMETRALSPGSTHTNNMYFDEIYFVRTAVEHIESINPYEISHPPLGKEIIAASILTFGMSPMGWRLFGAIFGVIMISVMYIFIKNIFGRTSIAACGALLLAFDFMRYVQTRIATIDTYAVFFILLAFFFMYRHITTDTDAPFRKSLAPLALSGIFFGLSFASKWIGFYAGAGLLVIYTIRLVQLGLHYKSNEKTGFGLYLTKTLLFSMLFFVIIPVIVYYLTYIPYGLARGMSLHRGMLWDPEFFRLVWGNQVSMFNYHSELVAVHPFSSEWWQWIFNIRPILYVNNALGDARSKYAAFGNPVVWWGGLLAMITMAVRVFTHRDGKALFILIGYLSQLLPWVAVTRIVFAYHYFPSTLFLVLALAHIFNSIVEHRERTGFKVVIAYTSVTAAVFAMFFPALSGLYMPGWYYSNFVRWFETWPF
jgi:dolichyl-phosphate-mannose--protein O-mannosyl transferase